MLQWGTVVPLVLIFLWPALLVVLYICQGQDQIVTNALRGDPTAMIAGTLLWLARGLTPQTCYRIPLLLAAWATPAWSAASSTSPNGTYLVAAALCFSAYFLSSPMLRGWHSLPWAIRYVVSGGLFVLPLVSASPSNRYAAHALLQQLRFPPVHPTILTIYFAVLLTPHIMEAVASLKRGCCV